MVDELSSMTFSQLVNLYIYPINLLIFETLFQNEHF